MESGGTREWECWRRLCVRTVDVDGDRKEGTFEREGGGRWRGGDSRYSTMCEGECTSMYCTFRGKVHVFRKESETERTMEKKSNEFS